MIPRYEHAQIARIWDLPMRYKRWQQVELAVIEAREALGRIPAGTYAKIRDTLAVKGINCDKVEYHEKILRHDLNAFLEERKEHLPKELHVYFHQGMTSYDTEEPGFAMALTESCTYILADGEQLLRTLTDLALTYRWTPMNGRTHGQEAEMQTYGKRILTWGRELATALEAVKVLVEENLKYSKLSGAIGTYNGIDPELEKKSLELLGFVPRIGVTQIMPRILYAPLANAIANFVLVVEKIANDIRLTSRSGLPLTREPFAKEQMGSSAMPHKKNNILCENTRGMSIMAASYAFGIQQTIVTWEERSIEQSSVERVFWPDLFHVALYAIKNTIRAVRGEIYPDNMLIEIHNSRGTFASNGAKEYLTARGMKYGISRKDAYDIVQLASFNVWMPPPEQICLREHPPTNLSEADEAFQKMASFAKADHASIQDIIFKGKLQVHPDLKTDEAKVMDWNQRLRQLFQNESMVEWHKLFLPSQVLKNESYIFSKVLGK